MPKHVLLCPPAYFDVIDQKNPYMSEKIPVDHIRAQRQWQALRSALEQAGCQVETIPPAPDLEDMVFAEVGGICRCWGEIIFHGRDRREPTASVDEPLS